MSSRKLKREVEYQTRLYEFKVDEAFYAALKNNEMINADVVYDEAVKREIPVKIIASVLPGLFKRYRKAALIKKTDKFALSERSSSPIPWYVSKVFNKVLSTQ